MMIPRVVHGADAVHKSFGDARAALRELQYTRVLHGTYMRCVHAYSENAQHVLVFERGVPLSECTADFSLGERVFYSLLGALHHMHESFGVAHLSVCPDHVLICDDGVCGGRVRLIDTSTLLPLGAPLQLVTGMRGGFAPPDALRGGHRVESRHDVYAVAATSLWAIRRQESFMTLHDPLYAIGLACIQNDTSAEAMRTVWSLRDEETFLLPHLILGFEHAVIDRVRRMLVQEPIAQGGTRRRSEAVAPLAKAKTSEVAQVEVAQVATRRSRRTIQKRARSWA